VNEIMDMKLVSLISVESGILVNICLGSISDQLHVYHSLQCNSESFLVGPLSRVNEVNETVFQMFPKLSLSPGSLKV
jgi:hypothetical protein